MIKIMLVDDHKIIREGLKSLLASAEGIKVVAEAENGKDAVEEVLKKKPDLVIMDINMPVMSGIESTRSIKKLNPGLPVLALTMSKEDEYVRKMVEAGASGYILKDSGKEELIKAIREVSAGKFYFSENVLDYFLTDMFKSGRKVSEEDKINLTDREKEILNMIVQELTNAEIARRLHLSVRTVEAHRRNLLAKTGSKNTAGLVKYALKKNSPDR